MTRSHILWPLAVSIALCACEENPPDIVIPQFDRAQDVALVCYDPTVSDGDTTGLKRFLPLECCKNEGYGQEGYCDSPKPYAIVLAFVTQTTYGEVAVVDLNALKVIDQDERIPLNSFVPVGGQPSDIAASWDGTMVYTANYETEDLSAINTAQAFGPTMVPATSINVGGRAAKLVIAKTESLRDRYAFVTQPSIGRLAVVELPSENGSQGRLLGYLRLGTYTGIQHAPPDTSAAGIVPWAITASDVTSSIYVGGKEGRYIIELDSEILVQEALTLDTPGPLGDGSIIRRLELEEFTTRDMVIEPELERWLYAVENEQGGVVVIDLVTGDILPVSENNPFATNAFSLDVPGRARAINMIHLTEEGPVDPFTFSGTFGIVSTTMAAIFVIDVEDRNAISAGYDTANHSLRTATDWWCEDEEDDLDECPIPRLLDEPIVEIDEAAVSGDNANFFARDAGVDSCDSGADFKGPDDETSEYGIRFPCDNRRSSNEPWRIKWEGDIGLSGVGVLYWEESEEDSGELVMVDESKDFCASGMLGSDIDGVVFDGIDGLEGYDGDLLEITSEPNPQEGIDCSQFEDADLIYRVKEILDSNKILIDGFMSPLPTQDCFGQVFSYKIRANDHWVLEGASTGHLHHGSMDLVTGQCVPYVDDDSEEELARWRNQRVYKDVEFYNYYMKFTLRNPKKDPGDVDSELFFNPGANDSMQITFETIYGFSKMNYVMGNDITDIAISPDMDLVLIDQAAEGLILFDLIDSFDIVGLPVN